MSRQPPPGDLLTRLAMDDDYAAFAARRGTGQGQGPGGGRPGGQRQHGRRATLVLFGATAAALAVLLTVSAVQTRATSTQREADRAALLDRIEQDQARVSGWQQRVDDVGAEVDRLRAASLRLTLDVAGVLDRVESLQMATGVLPVSGPGVRITVDDAASGAPAGRIRDTDLQLLANGLWQAGAEAIAVGGQRLTARSAIRTAGEAITVNYRSLSPPYVVTAIGDPQTLPAEFLETPAGQSFSDLRANFGVVFDLETADSVVLPGLSLGVTHAQSAPLPAGRDEAGP